jgi:hypothetical protein
VAFLFVVMPIFERMKRSFLAAALAVSLSVSAQVEFSLGTGVSVLRNLSPQQKFWAIGQTVQANAHFSPTQSAYAWLDYYTEGKFKNSFTASAKSPLTSPQQIAYTATGRLTYRHFSLGWKHYFKGSYQSQKELVLYGSAGFGFLFAKVRNSYNRSIDSSLYQVQTIEGANKIRRLTFDISAGSELPVGGNFFLFGEARTWLPASGNTSPYLHNQKNVPLPVMVSAGLRVLFGFSY